jgi:hypothetical protein
MKKLNILFTLIIIAFFTISLFAKDSGKIAIIIKAKGKVSVVNTKSKKSKKAKRGLKLYSGDKIVTGSNGKVAIKFSDDGSMVRIRKNSTCIIKGKLQKDRKTLAKNVYVEVGTIFSKITKQKSLFRVSTPTSVASVKGTMFWTVQEGNGGATYYYGEEGIVEIVSKGGSALLKKGQTGYVKSKNAKPIITKTKPGEGPGAGEEGGVDDFDIEFMNDKGQKVDLKFKVETKK